MGGMNEFGASCFADGWKAAGGKETDLAKALMKEFGLDEHSANWHVSRAFHPETASNENMRMRNDQIGLSEGGENVEETDPFFSKENQEWLRRSIRQVEEGHVVTHELIEPEDEEDDVLSQRAGELWEMVAKLRAVKDWHWSFDRAVTTYALKKPERVTNLLGYMISKPEATSSDILEFISNQPDFYEDAAYADEEKTIKDYFELPEGTRIELIDGRFYGMGPVPPTINARIRRILLNALANYIDNHQGFSDHYGVLVQLDGDDRTLVRPDAVVICDQKKLKEDRVIGAPDLVIEVATISTLAMLKSIKKRKYEKAGVKEYWVIDPIERCTTVYLFGKKTKQTEYGFDEPVPVNIWDGDLRLLVFPG